MATLGQRLGYERARAGLTLRAVADATGLSNAALSQIETGHTKQPAFETVAKLCALYGIRLDDLLDHQLQPKANEKEKEKGA